MTIILHDDAPEFVPLTTDPYRYDYTQESFIIDMFGHYRNQQLPMSILWMPQWLKEGIYFLSHVVNVDQDRKRLKDGIR